jgi:hypothetical protein
MHKDLKEIIETSKSARDKLLAGEMNVKDCNGVAASNHNILSAHVLDLRTRMFLSESASQVTRQIAAIEQE